MIQVVQYEFARSKFLSAMELQDYIRWSTQLILNLWFEARSKQYHISVMGWCPATSITSVTKPDDWRRTGLQPDKSDKEFRSLSDSIHHHRHELESGTRRSRIKWACNATVLHSLHLNFSPFHSVSSPFHWFSQPPFHLQSADRSGSESEGGGEENALCKGRRSAVEHKAGKGHANGEGNEAECSTHKRNDQDFSLLLCISSIWFISTG